MEADYQNIQDMRIDTIRRQFGITLGTAFRYHSDNKEEIRNIGNIFALKGNDKEKVFVLLYLFSSGAEPSGAELSAIQKYCSQTGLAGTDYNLIGLVDKYKITLITALLYNPAFYAMALNFQEAVNAGFTVGEVDEDSLPLQTKNDNILPFTVGSRSFHRTVRIAAAAAAGLLLILFLSVLSRSFNPGMEKPLPNTWVANLKEPEKDQDGVSYLSFEEGGARIGIPSPLVGIAMGTNDNPADPGQSIAYYTKAIHRNKKNPDLYVNRGVAYTLGGYLDSAIRDFDKAIELDSQNTAAYYNRAIARVGKNSEEMNGAIRDLKAAIAVDGDRESFYALGTLYFRQYENDESRPAGLLKNAIEAFDHIQGYKNTDVILDYLLKPNN